MDEKSRREATEREANGTRRHCRQAEREKRGCVEVGVVVVVEASRRTIRDGAESVGRGIVLGFSVFLARSRSILTS